MSKNKTIWGKDRNVRANLNKVIPKLEEGHAVLVEVSEDSLLKMFNEETAPKVGKLFHEPGVDSVVVFVNDTKDSPEYGSKTAVKVGPTQKIKSLDDCLGRFIGEPALKTAKIALFFCKKAGGIIEMKSTK